MDTVKTDDSVFDSMKIFLSFTCEDSLHSIEEVINASIHLLKECPTSRFAVLKFYKHLFQEHCHEYCILNVSSQTSSDKPSNSSIILSRFMQTLNSNSNQQNHANREVNENKTSFQKDEANSLEDGPQSPTREVSGDWDMEDLSLGNNSTQKEDFILLMSLLEKQILKLGDILNELSRNDTDDIFTDMIFDWALDLSTEMSKSYSDFVPKTDKCNNVSLLNALNFWNHCLTMQMLTRLIFDCVEKKESVKLIDQILTFAPDSNWILASLFTNMSQSTHLTTYIENLMNAKTDISNTIAILSHVSEHNPYAIVNCSKSNLSFLLKICTNSKPLLDLLAYEIVKKVDMAVLNELAESHALDDLDENINYCLLNAPNSYELLEIAFELVVHANCREALNHRVMNLLSMLTRNIHHFVYGSVEVVSASADAYSTIVSLRNNIQKLISNQSIVRNISLKKIQLQLIKMICIFYGTEFTSEVFHHLMNVSVQSNNSFSYDSPKMNPLLLPLTKSLQLQMGSKFRHSIRGILKLNFPKYLSFWATLMSFFDNFPPEIDIQDLVYYLNQKSFVASENIFKTYYILKILDKVSIHNSQLFQQEHYKFCYALVGTYFDLMNIMQVCEDHSLLLVANSLVLTQRLLTTLALYRLNEHIIGCCLLEFVQVRQEQFSSEFCQHSNSPMNTFTNLLVENMNSSSLKVKKNPLLPFPRGKAHLHANSSAILNRQFLIDLLQSCIKGKTQFAISFVDSLSKELLIKEAPWLEEDPKDGQIQHLRMTFETDLYIYRLFNKNPVLWNILEFLSREECLKYCLVVIRCLMNVLRTNLSSSSLNDKNVLVTKRLITIIANGELLPQKPFIYIRQLVPDKVKFLEMSYILHDLTKYIRDNIGSSSVNFLDAKTYLNRLRIILAHKNPDEIYLKIFKNI